MFKCFCLGLLILIYSSAVYAQDVKLSDKERMEKGNQIIENARKAIESDKLISSLVSLQLSIKSVSDLKQGETANAKDISVLLPDKIFYVYSMTKPFESKSTSVWNGEKYKKLSEFISPDGQRTVRDVTNSDLNSSLGKFVKDRETLEKFKKVAATDPKEKLNDALWGEIFPLILMHPFETNAEFRYVGKAKSADREANIVDTTTNAGRSIRLLFDSKTKQLMLMTEKFIGFDGDYENNYYYSNREKVDNVLIPKKIKVEHRFTPTGKEAKVSYTYIDVIDFKINPKFKPNFFDIN